ncbi:MAG TPA: hypothetical protein VIP46_12080 [Pyrinomonadaceae bacterium]
MYQIQLLLPLYDNEGRDFARAEFARVRDELAEKFGGITAYTRAPAEGVWKDAEGGVTRDSVVAFEVVAETLERDWWAGYRDALAARFRQDEVLITATRVERL